MEEGSTVPAIEEERDAGDSSSTSSCVSDGQEASEDAQFIRLLDAMDHLLSCRDSLAKSLSQGWMEIASARYAMGPSRISHSLFSLKPYSASTLVSVSGVDDHVEEAEEDEQVRNLQQEFRFAIRVPHEDDLSHNQISGDQTAKPEVLIQTGLRQRHTSGLEKARYADDDSEGGDLSAGNESDMAQDVHSGSKGYDPLAWFGTLVSPHLRIAQTSFREALEVLVELATVQSTMLTAYQHIKESGGLV